MIGVLIVDDERLTRELHAQYIERVEGFEVVGECSGARAAVTAVLERGDAIDLVLLDMTMPDGSGLDVARFIRSRAADVDIMAVTAVRDSENVRAAAALGIAQYVVKPFTFATFRERLEQYRDYRRRAADATGDATQAEIDALLGALRPAASTSLPKGLAPATLDRVAAVARAAGAISAAEAGEKLGMSRVAARRYLEYLADEKRVERSARYGAPGRPETEYVWR